jgi:hypothetical protein
MNGPRDVSAPGWWVGLEFDPSSKDRPRDPPAGIDTQRRGFGGRTYNPVKPNTRTSYSEEEWMDRIPNSQERRTSDPMQRQMLKGDT